MIGKDIMSGLRLEMKALGVYVPKPPAEEKPQPETEAKVEASAGPRGDAQATG